ncbi:Protein-disulfide isomerase [Aliiroseovarius sediminilitoris]|uniref:Protein-disulfide isomerase n=1 Tax=Aliiroseovarius sediminilitoris TaxID=1173584 RepID=A0A1I0R4I2_9RHOB|nr:DsbA family protein [Aliiroseovarius sediminilitoris]SEW35430.1 Protein-disulfide isomerase [Aliiroseovarius sediminilitoris]
MKLRNGILALAIGLATPFGTWADELDEGRIKELALEAIRENPSIIMEAVSILEQQKATDIEAARADVLTNQRNLLELDPNAPVLGNPDGDVTVVEFFDYNCPYCRRAMDEVQGLLEDDADVRLVYREWPILGEGSVFAAKAALAAREQGKYEAFHWALMGMSGRAEEASVMRIASEVGLDIDQLRRDMQAPEIEEHISTSMNLAQSLGFNGTPSFVIGDELVPGFVEKSQLVEIVDATRKAAE